MVSNLMVQRCIMNIIPFEVGQKSDKTIWYRNTPHRRIALWFSDYNLCFAIHADEMRAAYKVGFKDGVALMKELQD